MTALLHHVIAFCWVELLPLAALAAPRGSGGRPAAGAWKLFILVAGLLVIFWKGFDLRRRRQKYYHGGGKADAGKKHRQ